MRSVVLAFLAALAVVVNAQLMLPASYLNAYDPGWEKIIAGPQPNRHSFSLFLAGKNRLPIVLINPNSGTSVNASSFGVIRRLLYLLRPWTLCHGFCCEGIRACRSEVQGSWRQSSRLRRFVVWQDPAV